MAAVTTALLPDGRFVLGIGSGEALFGPEEKGFFDFYRSEVLPRLR